tara:strand:+ start:2958 stop:3284 length:327 start_codon:yes stop_codon:yes gene_type:complete
MEKNKNMDSTLVSENTKLTFDLKTISLIIGVVISVSFTYFTLNSKIDKAMVEPAPDVTRMEFNYKDELVRSSIEQVEKDVNQIKDDISEIKEQLNKMDERLYEMSKNR